jgi:hypothetical protein
LDNSDKILTVGHFYKAGDLITLLPGLQYLYRKNGTKTHIYQKIGMPSDYSELQNVYGNNTSMNHEMFEMLKPLIECQPYIEKIEEWNGEPVELNTINSRDSRLIPLPNSDLYFWMFFVFPNLSCDLSIPWIELPPNGNIFHDIVTSEHAIISRTERFLNNYIDYHFLKDYQDRLIFSGTEKEHHRFCGEWKLDIPRLVLNNFLELAQAIKKCKFLLSNQTFAFHIADSMKTKRILEVCAAFPNTLPHGANGRAFVHQKSLELFFLEYMQ